MKVYVNIKKAGSRRSPFEKREYEIIKDCMTVRELILFFVEKEVEKFNEKGDASPLIYMTEKELDDKASEGKISFDSINGDKKADLKKASENAIMCYEDGIVRILKNDDELGALDSNIKIDEGDLFTFIRLTFLAGRMW